MLERDDQVDYMVIETTGVADPLPIILTLLGTELRDLTRLDSIATTPESQQALLKAALELGQTYAKLAPSLDTGGLVSNMDYDFPDLLWRAQQPDANGLFAPKWMISLQIDTAVKGLKRLLDGVSDPVATVKFLNNLLNAATNVFNLTNQIKDAKVIRNLIAFGIEYAK